MTYHQSQFFSESILRNKYDNHSLFKSCKLGTTCAQETLPLLHYCSEQAKTFIGFIPDTCMNAFIEASTMFQKKFWKQELKICLVFPKNPKDEKSFWTNAKVWDNGKFV